MVRRILLLLVSLGWPLTSQAATDVLTWHNDAARTGQNLTETSLTPGNVNATNFGKLFTITVDGKVDGQPLYVSGQMIVGKGVHNVLYTVTEHDSIYAHDADDGTLLWQASMLGSGETTSDTRGCGQVTPEIGITATPVIDRKAGANGTIYLAAMSKNAAGIYFQRIHALDLSSGAEQSGSPREVLATYPGAGDNSSGGSVVFDPKQYKERPGLVLANGLLYTFWSSHCDIRPYTGWVIAYNPATLARVSVLNLTPNGTHGAIWTSGAAPAVDASGNIFFLDADGTFETTLDANGFPNRGDFGNCFLKLATSNNTLQIADYFTMYNTVSASNADQDLGSGGAVVLPDMTDANGAVRHLTVGAGKDTHLYLANRDNMGKFVANATSNANIYQDLSGQLAGGVFSAPAYFNGRLYVGAVGDQLKAFHFTNARLDATPQSKSTVTFGYPGTTPAISANGNTNGIVWAAVNGGTAALYAFDANDLTKQLYSSNDAANGRDHFGAGNKFIVPTIANGKVYVGTTNGVGVFGLFNPPRLGNISTRANIGTGDSNLIAGFIVQGSTSKQLLLRGLGPSLKTASGAPLPGTLQDPVLDIYDHNGQLFATNDNWGDSAQRAEIVASGLAPADPREAVVTGSALPNTYTAVVHGANNSTGIGLVEVYDLSKPPSSRLANISSRGFVGSGDNVLIAGTIVIGTAPQSVLFRAIGPDLTGVANPLPNPALELYDANGVLVLANDDWRSTQQAEITATQLQPGNDNDAAILATLAPANYTAIVRGVSGATGIALVEAYALE